MIVLALEEFTTRRRTAQTDLETALRPFVKDAVDLGLNTHGWEELLRHVRTLYAEAYAEESGERGRRPDSRWTDKLLTTLRKTKNRDENSVERITIWLATAILSKATVHASQDDPEELFLEWVDMHDSKVRPAHAHAHGQRRPIGEKFRVGGAEMEYPGDPSVDPALWMNCRCTVRPVLASEALVASVSEKSWDGAASRFTPEQWKSSCVLHVCDGPEKSCHKLPIKEPDGALSRAGVHAAAGRIGSAQGPPDKIAAAKRALRGAYKTLGETPPDSLTAGGEPMTDPNSMMNPVPWHGVLAPEGEWSGDKRRFAEGSLTTRDLPLPLTWQKTSDDGHKGSVVVAKIEKTQMVDGQMRATGHFIQNPEADEVVGMVGEFGKFGVSVDADDVEFDMEVDPEDEGVTFTRARVSSASVVPIPAFAQAYVALGEPPEDWAMSEPDVAPDEEVLSPAMSSQFGRGPGWVTNPEGTARLHEYWVHGEGAAKINWGVDGDFNRCRVQVGEEIGESDPAKLRFINQICAQWHHDAKGYWPGHPHAGETVHMAADTLDLKSTAPAAALSLVAAGGHQAPADWFKDPGLTGPTPLTVTEEGRVFGHLATWGTCHIGFKDTCVAPPQSASNYAYFLTGQVTLDNGQRAACGPITLGGGHASPRLGLRAAVAHYDDSGSAVADVTCGEDDTGIWVSGWVRPGTSDEAITALRASPLSGDWRNVAGNLELVAALAVNTPGFPVPHIKVAASSEGQMSLVASGIVTERPKPQSSDRLDPEEFAERVAAAIEGRQARRERMAALAARVRGSD